MNKLLMYSPFPISPFEPALGNAISLKSFRNEIRREDYPELPWPIDENLVGSQWRNLHTGTLAQVTRIITGKPWQGKALIPCFPPNNENYDSQDSPGFWCVDQFLVEHWVRIDHWPLEWQLRWFGVELGHQREQISQAEQFIANLGPKPADSSDWSRHRKQYLQDIKKHRGDLEEIGQRIHAFAQKYSLVIPLELLNEGVELATHPEQLRLF